MRAVIQRVKWATVHVNGGDERDGYGEEVGRIGPGLLVYVAAGQRDGPEDAAALSTKVAGLRIFEDERGAMNRSVLDGGGRALVVSQFTLFGDCRKGRRPSFNGAMESDEAARLVEAFCQGLEERGVVTAQGWFGAKMAVESLNRGPVTILLDSKKTF